MQYTVTQIPQGFDLGVVTEMLTVFDPAAVVDIDDSGSTLRLSTVLGTAELVPLLKAAGVPIAARSGVEQVPSECCGGCGG